MDEVGHFFANSERPLKEAIWGMQTIIEERISGKKQYNLSKYDLKNKTSPLDMSV